MEDENNIVKAKLEDKELWDEPRFWDTEKNGLYIQTKTFNFKKYCADLWMKMQDDS